MINDLGQLNGPVLVFGGPYSNLQATTALLAQADKLSIQPKNIICTGDIIAYAADPAETLDAIIESGMHVVMGNCEESLGFDGDDCGCGFDEGSECDLLSRQWYTHAKQCLTEEHRQWMRELPSQVRFSAGAYTFAAIHGGTTDISRWVFGSTPEAIKRDEITKIEKNGDIDAVIGGHCGLPFISGLGEKLWFNPGVIGMPANDGTARTWYGIITPEQGSLNLETRALDYDHEQAAARMISENLSPAYAKTLTNGLWPNLDVLNEAECKQVGIPHAPISLLWTHGQLAAAE